MRTTLLSSNSSGFLEDLVEGCISNLCQPQSSRPFPLLNAWGVPEIENLISDESILNALQIVGWNDAPP